MLRTVKRYGSIYAKEEVTELRLFSIVSPLSLWDEVDDVDDGDGGDLFAAAMGGHDNRTLVPWDKED